MIRARGAMWQASSRRFAKVDAKAGSSVALVVERRRTSNDFGPLENLWIASEFMDLRDKFAVHIAAALTGALSDPAQIARRSYDFAEALVAERARRIDADEARALAEALPFGAIAPELSPDELDPEWLEEPYDPSWDMEPRWPSDAAPEAAPDTARGQTLETEVVRPGLARTQPADADANRVVAGKGA